MKMAKKHNKDSLCCKGDDKSISLHWDKSCATVKCTDSEAADLKVRTVTHANNEADKSTKPLKAKKKVKWTDQLE